MGMGMDAGSGKDQGEPVVAEGRVRRRLPDRGLGAALQRREAIEEQVQRDAGLGAGEVRTRQKWMP
jgi:hypothetical protein